MTCTAFAQAQDQQGGHSFTLRARQMPLTDVFREIKQQTGLQMFFSHEQLSEQIDLNAKVDVNFRNAELEEVLQYLFKGKYMQWKYREDAIVVWVDKDGPRVGGNERPPAKDSAQTRRITITGTVTNEAGDPVVGATVFLKQANRGTVTNDKGRFTFTDVNENVNSSLVVSSVGYNRKEVGVRGKNVNIQLETAISSLDETVVIAYGTSTKRNLTGSVSRVTAEEIAKQPVANPLQALQGRVAGLNIVHTTGLPGSDFTIELRGRNSISSGINPLYIVDGVPFTSTPLTWDLDGASDYVKPFPNYRLGLGPTRSSNPLNTINAADIESIEVLKDADATAIYGSRGANGVILITTKRGRIEDLKADINVYTGWGRVGHMINYLNTPQYLQMRREALQNDGVAAHPEDYDLNLWDSTRYTDWQKAMIGGTAHITDAQASVSGGTANAQYRISGGYRRETTVYPGDFSYQKAAGRMQVALSMPDQRLKADISVSYVSDRNNLVGVDLTRFATLPPNAPSMYTADGTLAWEPGVLHNPYANALRTYKANTENLMVAASLNYQVLPGLQLKANLGYTHVQMDEVQTNPKKAFSPANSVLGFSDFANNSVKTWIVEPQLYYQIERGKGKLDILAGTTFQQDIRDQQGFSALGYTNDALLEDRTAATQIVPMPGTMYALYRYNAIFGRVNYNWRGKYIVNFNGRRDGSSRFGPGRQFANFGSIGLAWIFSEEPFIKKAVPFLSFGKLRASYGITGNDQIADYGYLDTYAPTPPYQGNGGLYNSRLFNPQYGWERSAKFETGLELGFMQDRFLLKAAYYSNRSSNQLIKYSLSGVSGFTSIRMNIPAVVANTGVELELNTVNIKQGNFNWSTGFNFTVPRNKLLAFPGLENSSYRHFYTIGEALNQFKGLRYLGVDPQTGVYILEDANKDNRLDLNDYMTSKPIGATLYGGLQNSLQYKGWQLDVLFQFVKQDGYDYSVGEGPVGSMVNQPVTVLDRWQKPGDITNNQRFTQTYGAAGTAYLYERGSDRQIVNASFIRLKNLSIAYQLPEKWIKRCKLHNCRLYLQGQNLLTITDYPGLDPENAATPTANAYPPLRVWTAGLQLVF